MKIINITTGTFAVFLLASSMANADTNYPASDFQPKVVYQDPDYKPAPSSASASPATDSQYPAANFQPKVLYNDPTYQHAEPSATSAGSMQKSGASRALLLRALPKRRKNPAPIISSAWWFSPWSAWFCSEKNRPRKRGNPERLTALPEQARA